MGEAVLTKDSPWKFEVGDRVALMRYKGGVDAKGRSCLVHRDFRSGTVKGRSRVGSNRHREVRGYFVMWDDFLGFAIAGYKERDMVHLLATGQPAATPKGGAK